MSTLDKTRQLEPKITGHLFGVDTVDWERLIFPDTHTLYKAHERFNPHIDEEFEDSEGNVVNRKTYDDMRRQGIL